MEFTTKHIDFEIVEDGIALATLNRPEQLNAFNDEMILDIYRIYRKCDEDDDIRVLIVTGKGRAFSAGADLSITAGDTYGERTQQVLDELNKEKVHPWKIKKPVIAAINGHAVGMSLTMAMMYDIRIVAEEAKLGFVFVRRGIVPENQSTWIVPRVVGLERAVDLLMTGRTFFGKQAVDYGLALESRPADQVLPRALEMARDIRDNCAPMSVAFTKQMIWEHMASTDAIAAGQREAKTMWWCGKKPDAVEGVVSFLEKRKPEWSMGPTADWPDSNEI